MDSVRLGVVGATGGMATAHRQYFEKIDGLVYAAAADRNADKLAAFAEETGVATFTDPQAMVDSGTIDALMVVTPHPFHPALCAMGLRAGLHVLCEKPVAVTAKEAAELNAVYEETSKAHPGQLFAGMLNQRDRPDWRCVKRLCSDGSVGELIRVSWHICDWFRSQTYYDSGGWRATWAGEGGGVLMNQAPHNLDLLQWFVGMPSRVTANVGLGRHHDIEVEDEVTALLEYGHGAVGTFVTSTGQGPAINRLEIVGQNGTVIADGGKLTFLRNHTTVREFIRTSEDGFADVPHDRMDVTPGGETLHHEAITRNFVETIRAGGTQDELIGPGPEMIHGLELGNAMLLSGLEQRPVDLPTDRDAWAAKLEELKQNSTFKKPEPSGKARLNFGGTF